MKFNVVTEVLTLGICYLRSVEPDFVHPNYIIISSSSPKASPFALDVIILSTTLQIMLSLYYMLPKLSSAG